MLGSHINVFGLVFFYSARKIDLVLSTFSKSKEKILVPPPWVLDLCLMLRHLAITRQMLVASWGEPEKCMQIVIASRGNLSAVHINII